MRRDIFINKGCVLSENTIVFLIQIFLHDYWKYFKHMTESVRLYSHWIKAKGYARIIAELKKLKEENKPFSAKAIDKEYPRLLKEEVDAISSLLKKADNKNELFDEIGDAFQKEKDELLKLI